MFGLKHPGTTRLIDSEMFYNSVNMELVDSAGVRETDDLIEKMCCLQVMRLKALV